MEASVKEITKSDFQNWKHHPVSKVVLQYLRDKQKFLEETAINAWIDGTIGFSMNEPLRGQIIELAQLSELEFEALQFFYQGNTDAAKAA